MSKEARRMSAQVTLSGADSRKRYSLLSDLSANRSRGAWHARQTSSPFGRARTDSPASFRASVENSDASEAGQVSPLIGSSSRPAGEGKSVPLFTRHASIRHSRAPSVPRVGASRRTASVSAASTMSTGSGATRESGSWKPRPMLLLGASTSGPTSPIALATDRISESPEVVEAPLPPPKDLDLSLLPRCAGIAEAPDGGMASGETSPITQDFNLQASLVSLDNSMQELELVSPPRSRRPSFAESVSSADGALPAMTRHLPFLEGIPESDTFTSLPSIASPRRAPRSRSASSSAATSPTALTFDAQEAASLLASATTTRRVRADSVARRRAGSVSAATSPTVPDVEVLAPVEPVSPTFLDPFAAFAPGVEASPVVSLAPLPSQTSDAERTAVSSSSIASPRTVSPISTWTDESVSRKKGFKLKSLFKSRASVTSPTPSIVALPSGPPSRRDVSTDATESGRSTDELSQKLYLPKDFARSELSSFGKIYNGEDGFEYLAQTDSVKASSQTGLDSLAAAPASPPSRYSRLINVRRDLDDLEKPQVRSLRGRSVLIGGPQRMNGQEESRALWKMIASGGGKTTKR